MFVWGWRYLGQCERTTLYVHRKRINGTYQNDVSSVIGFLDCITYNVTSDLNDKRHLKEPTQRENYPFRSDRQNCIKQIYRTKEWRGRPNKIRILNVTLFLILPIALVFKRNSRYRQKIATRYPFATRYFQFVRRCMWMAWVCMDGWTHIYEVRFVHFVDH